MVLQLSDQLRLLTFVLWEKSLCYIAPAVMAAVETRRQLTPEAMRFELPKVPRIMNTGLKPYIAMLSLNLCMCQNFHLIYCMNNVHDDQW